MATPAARAATNREGPSTTRVDRNTQRPAVSQYPIGNTTSFAPFDAMYRTHWARSGTTITSTMAAIANRTLVARPATFTGKGPPPGSIEW